MTVPVRRPGPAVAALAAILAVTVAWWALALWPAGDDPPAWLGRTRAICFGAVGDGLPHAGGWILLIGEPLGMLAVLLLGWGVEVRAGLRALGRSRPGRVALGLSGAGVVLGLTAAGVRVASAAGGAETFEVRGGETPPVRTDRAAPPLRLVDQHGDTVGLERFRGRPVVVAFAFAHCETVCPLLVRNAVTAVERARTAEPALLVVTLDPWRDTPERLGPIAEAWRLPGGAHLLGGSVAAVARALDDWGIPRDRDTLTGAITHPTAVYLIDPEGRLAFVTPPDPDRLTGLIQGLRGESGVVTAPAPASGSAPRSRRSPWAPG